MNNFIGAPHEVALEVEQPCQDTPTSRRLPRMSTTQAQFSTSRAELGYSVSFNLGRVDRPRVVGRQGCDYLASYGSAMTSKPDECSSDPEQTLNSDTRSRVVANMGRMTVAAATIVGPFIFATASPASAACDGGDRHHQVQIFRGGDEFIAGRGKATNIAGGKERWCDLWEEGEYLGPWIPLPQVCAYQSQMSVQNPDGSPFNGGTVHTNAFHAGCSYTGWGFHDPLDGNYVEDKRFSSKWMSDATTGMELIGVLVD